MSSNQFKIMVIELKYECFSCIFNRESNVMMNPNIHNYNQYNPITKSLNNY